MAVDSTKLRQDYDAWHAQLEDRVQADDPWHQLVRAHLCPERDLAGRRVLEIGCGRGGFSCWLYTHATPPPDLFARDFSEIAVAKGRELAQRSGITGIDWGQGDITNLDFADASFDTVISCETIEHVPDPRRAVRELGRVLRPGGRLFLTTPNYLGLAGVYRVYCWLLGRKYAEEGQPWNNVTLLPATVRWVRQAGLRIEAVDGIGHWLPIPRTRGLHLRFLDRARWVTRWGGCHSLVVGTKG